MNIIIFVGGGNLELIQMIKALADETRMRVLNLLKEGELCVCELEILLNISQSNASRHLNKLTTAKILDYYKIAQYVYYKINESTIKKYPFMKEIIEEHAKKIKQSSDDFRRLEIYKKSHASCDDLKDGKVCFCN